MMAKSRSQLRRDVHRHWSSVPRLAILAVATVMGFACARAWGQADFHMPASGTNAPGVITNLAQLRVLTRTAAALGIPVRLEGTVTYGETQWPSLFVQDGESAAYVLKPVLGEVFEAGERLRIEGKSREGFSPMIVATGIQRVGRAPLPPPVQTTLEEIVSGRYDARLVRVVTTVRWMHLTYGRLYLHVGEASGRYEVHIPDHKGPLPTHLMDARVELTGITGMKLDSHGGVMGAGMSISRVDDITIVSPAPPDPWRRPAQIISSIPFFHPNTSFGQQTRITGVVTLSTPSGQIYVQDASGGIEVRLPGYQRTPDEQGKYLPPPAPADLRVGDQVEVIGYAGLGSYAPVLRDARVRRLGRGPLPVPELVSATNVLSLHLDSVRTRLLGRVVANESRPGKPTVEQRLTIGSDDVVFFAAAESAEPFRVQPGSLVELTGVCSFDADESRRLSGFRLLLSGPSDLRVLSGPPVITAARFVKFGVPVVVLALGWVGLLRRQVRRRTSQLAQANAELRREIEHRAAVEKSFRESESRFHKAFQASPAMMALTRLGEGTFVAANDAFYSITGYREREVIGRSAKDLGIYSMPRQREEYVQLIREQGSVRDRELQLRVKDGGVRTVLVSGELIQLEGEAHLLTVGLDITGRKQSEIETVKALARERELSILKSNFVSLVSHEFRTPLGVIQSACDVLDRYLDRLPPEKRRKHLDMIFRSTRNLAQLVDGVLLLGKVEDGRVQFAPAPLDLAALCAQIIDEVHSATGAQGIVRLEAEPNLPGAWSDANLLRHIFSNLLSNAVKYSPQGTPVTFRVERHGSDAIFAVEDKGIGIPAEDQRNLFTSFARGANVGSRPGTGLGLVIVRRCVALHGGSIHLESVENGGTTVTVRLPLFAPAGDRPGAPALSAEHSQIIGL